MKVKKFVIAMCLTLLVVMSALVVCASEGTGVSGFVNAINSNITQDAMWNQVTPFAPLMVTIFLFAFGYMIFKRVTKAGSKGKFRS